MADDGSVFGLPLNALPTTREEYDTALRAKGMTQVAKDAGVGRESLYKALAPGAKPRFETVMKVARALGVKFTAKLA